MTDDLGSQPAPNRWMELPPPPERSLRSHLALMLDNALGPTPRLALAAVARLKLDVAFLEGRAVALARREGYDWGRIGRLLGSSRQAVRQRWGKRNIGDDAAEHRAAGVPRPVCG